MPMSSSSPKYMRAIWFSLFVSFLFAIIEQNWNAVLVSVLTLLSVSYIVRLNRRAVFKMPGSVIVWAVFFIYASLFLGEAYSFYNKFWWWDVLLHASSAIGFGLIGMILLIALSRSKKVHATPIVVSFFAFTFAVSIGALWEILEFIMDLTFGFNMQKSGLRDTMADLIVNSVGALMSCAAGFLYLKFGKSDRFINYIEDAVESVFE